MTHARFWKPRRSTRPAGVNFTAAGGRPPLDLCRDGETAQLHVLLIGPPALTSVLLDTMRPALSPPVVEAVIESVSLPREGTVILRNVGSLDTSRQQELSTWMNTTAARVVTICETSLYEQVVDGSFSADLYYRLNTFMLEAETEWSDFTFETLRACLRYRAEPR